MDAAISLKSERPTSVTGRALLFQAMAIKARRQLPARASVIFFQ